MQKEAFARSAADWKVVSEQEKKPYVDAANRDKERFDMQKEELREKGYYTFPDGTKSIDPENKIYVQVRQKRKREDEKSTIAPDSEYMPTRKVYKRPEVEDVMRRLNEAQIKVSDQQAENQKAK